MLIHRLADLFLALRYLAVPLVLVFVFTIVGMVGYMILLDLNWIDGLYQSVITLSTVGSKEVVPFTGPAKLFTVFLILLGVGTVFYTITLLAASVVEGDVLERFRRRVMARKVRHMRNHIIVCGFGRVGEEIADALNERDREFVVIDTSESECERAREKNYNAILGDAQNEETLIEAGIERAESLLVSTTTDSTNTYIVLTAKNLNPKLFTIARSENPLSAHKLELAGADRIVSPYAIGGKRMALNALQPMMTDYMDALAHGKHGDLLIAEFEVESGSSFDGATLSECFSRESETTVLGIVRQDGRLVVGPRGSEQLFAGDTVLVLTQEGGISGMVAGSPAPPRGVTS